MQSVATLQACPCLQMQLLLGGFGEPREASSPCNRPPVLPVPCCAMPRGAVPCRRSSGFGDPREALRPLAARPLIPLQLASCPAGAMLCHAVRCSAVPQVIRRANVATHAAGPSRAPDYRRAATDLPSLAISLGRPRPGQSAAGSGAACSRKGLCCAPTPRAFALPGPVARRAAADVSLRARCSSSFTSQPLPPQQGCRAGAGAGLRFELQDLSMLCHCFCAPPANHQNLKFWEQHSITYMSVPKGGSLERPVPPRLTPEGLPTYHRGTPRHTSPISVAGLTRPPKNAA